MSRRAARLVAFALLSLIAAAPAQEPDPTSREVPLPASSGWDAALVYESDVGIWTVRSVQLLERYGCPEVIGLDDRGRCTILVSYSGKWTPFQTVEDGEWLGALAHVDLDPRRPGPELYTGGKKGNLIQIWPRPTGGFDAIGVGHVRGLELHTFVAGDLLPERPGDEMLAFTRSGVVFDVRPEGGDGPSGFRLVRIAELPGRARDAVLLPARGKRAPRIVAATRAQRVLLLRMTEEGLARETVLRESMGFGRIARRPSRPGSPEVVYVTRDDGVILRLEEQDDGSFAREVVYGGPQGPRGIVAGRFHEDPEAETVAVFGYSKKVQLLTRLPGRPWKAETLFTDRDKGHWLAVAEVDGRNATDELIGSGYGRRIFLLKRPPGYGLDGVATDPEGDEARAAADTARAGTRPPRVAVGAGRMAVTELSPLRYGGGFETKTLVYETLVRRDAEGRIVPALASSWRFEQEGRSVVFTLRAGARFHDGRPVTADAVRLHFRRWVGLPEHGWLRASGRIQAVQAVSPREVRVTLDRPYALLADLCVVNPCAIQAPGALDREGDFVRPVGSGPFAFEGVREDGRVLRYRRAGGGDAAPVDLVRFEDDGERALAALLSGDVDVLVGGWSLRVPPERARELREDPAFDVWDAPGSSVVYLSFSLKGATEDAAVRRRVAAAVNRTELVRRLEGGLADPCTGWAAPSVGVWPQGRPSASAPEGNGDAEHAPLRIVVPRGAERDEALARAVAAQLRRSGLPARVGVLDRDAYRGAVARGAYDVRVERTWGVPYDPYVSLVARFLPPPQSPSAASQRFFGVDPRLTGLVEEAARTPGQEVRAKVYGRIQALLDSEALIVPLYVPRRVAVVRKGLPRPRLDHDIYTVDLRPLAGE